MIARFLLFLNTAQRAKHRNRGRVFNGVVSLRSKRFREAKSEEKAKNGGFGVLPARKWGESKNKKEGVGEGKEGNACRQTP